MTVASYNHSILEVSTFPRVYSRDMQEAAKRDLVSHSELKICGAAELSYSNYEKTEIAPFTQV